jgi:hypothetical protein
MAAAFPSLPPSAGNIAQSLQTNAPAAALETIPEVDVAKFRKEFYSTAKKIAKLLPQMNELAYAARRARQLNDNTLMQKNQEAYDAAAKLHNQYLAKFRLLTVQLKTHMGIEPALKYIRKVESVVTQKSMERQSLKEGSERIDLSSRSPVVRLTVGLMQTYEKCQASYERKKGEGKEERET